MQKDKIQYYGNDEILVARKVALAELLRMEMERPDRKRRMVITGITA
jgi:hypothetical protein